MKYKREIRLLNTVLFAKVECVRVSFNYIADTSDLNKAFSALRSSLSNSGIVEKDESDRTTGHGSVISGEILLDPTTMLVYEILYKEEQILYEADNRTTRWKSTLRSKLTYEN